MRRKDEKNELKQRAHLLDVAWKLFYEKGYENTTMTDILREADCSKGRFYYYFSAKAELLDALYELFDRKYEEHYDSLDKDKPALEILLGMNRLMFDFMEREIGWELLRNLYISQLHGETGISLWSRERSFNKLLAKVVQKGQAAGEIRMDLSVEEIVEDMVVEERSRLITWCLAKGSYPLCEIAIPRLRRSYLGYQKVFEEERQ